MSKDAFNRIKEGLEEALAYARGENTGARVTVINVTRPSEQQPPDPVKRPVAKKDA